MQLRNYQIDAVNSVYEYFAQGNKGNPLVVLPTGAGKSVVIAELIRSAMAMDREQRFIMATHVKELIAQNHQKLMTLWHNAPAGIYSAGLGKKQAHHPIIFGGIQSMRDKAEIFGYRHVLFVDECFVAGTKIKTPSGEKDIDKVRCGDIVYSGVGEEVVLATSCKQVYTTYKIEFSNGTNIECTGSHPIFTENGWKQAGLLEVGEIIIDFQGLRTLWENFLSMENEPKGSIRECFCKTKLLLSKLCEEITPDSVRCRSEKKDKRHIEGDKAQTYKTWGERAVASFTTASITSCARNGLGSGISNKNKQGSQEWDLSKLLQSGHCQSGEENSNRNKWQFTLPDSKKRAGHKENSTIGGIRVDSVTCIKRESPIHVFNLHISGHPSYFANGIMAHNCHLLPNKADGGYHTFLKGLRRNNPDIKVVGFTATPYRMAGGHLLNGDVFTDICFEYPILKLIERGYLSPVYTAAPKLEQVDLSNVRTVAGEYNQREMQNAFMADCVTERALHDVFQRATQHKSFLFFCAGVEHAQHTHKLLQMRGLKGQVVYDKTPPKERDKAIESLRNGTYDYLCNNAVLTTGTDIPRIDCVVLLRSTKSRGLYVQMVGRGMRLFEGKTHCLLLDYGGNVDRFGAIDNQPQGKKTLTDTGEAGTAPFKRCGDDNLEDAHEGCGTVNRAKATHCIKCGAPFIQKAPHEDVAAQGDIINKPLDVVLGINPSHIYFEHHIKRDTGNETLRIDYHWGVASHCSEWMGLARASNRLKQWFPNGEHLKATSIKELITICKDCAVTPSTVWIKKQPDSKYYEVLKYDFTT